MAELSGGPAVPEKADGAVLFADVAGFTALTTSLAELFGPRRGAEEVPVYLNRLYEALIGEVRARAGSVIGFAGDAITCWFPADDGRSAVACAVTMQADMARFASLRVGGGADGPTVALDVKVAVSRGTVRRFAVGDETVQLLDVIAGDPVAELEALNNASRKGQIVLSAAVAAAVDGGYRLRPLEDAAAPAGAMVVSLTDGSPAERRERGPVEAHAGAGGAGSLGGRGHEPHRHEPAPPDLPERWFAAPEAAELAPAQQLLGRWLLPTVKMRLSAGGGDFLTELRPVAALFLAFDGLDLTGDEGAGTKLDRLVRLVQQVVVEYGGNVLQLTTGDKGTYLYAAFGAPVSHEDDVSRCAAAALDLREAVLGLPFVAELKIGLGHGTARTGAYGSITRRTYGALGRGTNMAARMMSAAPHAAIYVSGAFEKALGGGFDLRRLEDVVVKGSAAPVEAFELVGRASGTPRERTGAGGRPLVGREPELEAVSAGMAEAAAGRGAVIQVVAEAGMGKSELLGRALQDATGVRVVGGACQAFGRTAPYQVWKGVFRQLLGIEEADSPEGRLRAAEAALGEVDPALAEQAHLLTQLLDLPVAPAWQYTVTDAEERNARRLALLLTVFRHAARATALSGRTLVLLLEDLHWLDPASAELLAAVAKVVPALPVLVLTSARPQAVEPDGAVGDVPGARLLRLGPLDEVAARQVVAARLAGAEGAAVVDEALVARIVERSGGNPFYLGELLVDLLQRAREGGHADLAELPTSLHSLILGRLDRLEHEALVNLKVASVVGRRFRTSWVSGCQGVEDAATAVAIAADAAAAAAAAAFAATDQAGLTVPVAPEPPTHAFNHAITRDVTYDSLSNATRVRLHTRLARFIEERVAGPAEPNLDLLAYHFALGDDPSKARHYLGAAGAAAKAAYANETAIDYFERLLALLDGVERLPTLLEVGEVMMFAGSYGPAAERLDEAAALATAANDRLGEATALRLLGELHERQGDHGRARTRLEAAARLCRELGQGAELTRVLLALGGNVLWHLGVYDEAAALLAEAVTLARAASDPRAAARALHGTANIHLYRGESAAAESAFLASLELRREARDEYGVANALNNLAIVAANAGDGARAEELFGESLSIRQRLGDVAGVAVALNNLGYMVAERGDLAGARDLYQQSLASRRELGDRLGLAISLNNLAGLMVRSGAAEEARRLYLESVELASAIDNRRETAAALAGLAGAVETDADAARMALVAERLLAGIGAAVDDEVRTAIELGKARAEPAAVPASLMDEALSEVVAWALRG